ncbi:TonB-dependent receptor, partial [Phenylobacterium sp.]|uniref:TonB-dependent receptor n=1 Tax=Phenylobacterium sp. TaxID=1871053 RepID=UPI0027362DE9
NEPFQMRTRTLEIGLRQENYENTVTQYLAGLRMPIGDTGWRVEGYVSEGRTKIINTQSGNVDLVKLEQLLSAADGGNALCAGGFNPFGANPLSAACRTFLRVDLQPTRDLIQQIGQVYASGDVMDLPAGPLSVVVGAEYRNIESKANPGSGAENISGFTLEDPEDGTSSFKDFFGEALIPLVKDAPFAKTLELNLGYRYSLAEFADKLTGFKSDEDSSSSFKAEINWQPVDILRFRASYQRAVRAPNFEELFAGGNDAPQYFDPCSKGGVLRSGGSAAQVAALCGATGVGDVAGYVQTPGSQLTAYLAGNNQLESERGDTITIGAVFSTPWENQWTERLRGSIDYYNIKVKDAILRPQINRIVADCFNYYGNNPTFSPTYVACNQTLIRGGGDILQLDNRYPGGIYDPVNDAYPFQFTNQGRIETSGIDFQVDYGFDWEWLGLSPSWGGVKANVIISKLFEYKSKSLSSLPLLDTAGTVSYFGAGLGQSFPEWRVTGTAAWTFGDFDVLGRTRYIGKMDNRLSVEFPGETFGGTKGVWYTDVSAGWKATDTVEVRLGVNNAFDKKPPQYSPNVQSGTDPSVFDVVGRRVFAQLRLRF